ncbi:MAG TPA: hypothetical protein VFP95_01195, partial [Gammaproteobacteria bacterium]|nr:hypothetical protein [Gammaproteobacteria bacterium]
MNKLLLLGLAAGYAALSTHAAIAADTRNTPEPAAGPAISVEAANRTLPRPDNFDASLVPDAAKIGAFRSSKRLIGNTSPQLAMPQVLSSNLQYTRTQPVGILSTHYDQQLDRPTFIWAGEDAGKGFDFYAYKRGEGALSYAQAYLKQFANRLKIAPKAIDQAELVFLHDDGEGPVIARYQQQVNGIDVMNRQLNVVMNQNLELVAISGYFATAKAAYNKDFSNAFRGGPQPAMNTMFNDLGIGVSAYSLYDTTKTRGGFTQFAPAAVGTASFKTTGGIQLTAPVGAKKVLFPVDGQLVPGWQMTVQAGKTGSQNR